MDDDVAPLEPDVQVICPLCKISTSDKEVAENHFPLADYGTASAQESHICVCDACIVRAMSECCCYFICLLQKSCEEDNVAQSWCSDCEEHLCDDCVKAHKRVKFTKDHAISQIVTTSRSEKRASESRNTTNDIRCVLHKVSSPPRILRLPLGGFRSELLSFRQEELVDSFCQRCESLLCQICLSDHEGHGTREAAEAAEEVSQGLKLCLGEIRIKRNILEESMGMLGSKLGELNIKVGELVCLTNNVLAGRICRNAASSLAGKVSPETSGRREEYIIKYGRAAL